ncbi:F-box only protein 6-like isoform X2 [Lineus longissimus]|uniref:F-box only protein 6-like isoform X2 n=1 Tax=Lineus longissimus TaxID=88925 RepID=UPI002B4F50A1
MCLTKKLRSLLPKRGIKTTKYSEAKLGMAAGENQAEAMPPFPLTDLPDDLLELVLSELSGPYLIHVAQLVCKDWKSIIDRPSIWKLKCLREYPNVFFSLGGVPEDMRTFYFKNPLNRNLIKNAYAMEDKKHWDVDGYCDFEIQTCFPTKAAGSDLLKIRGWNGGELKCWATSYMWCGKMQKIDLVSEGCSEFLLDEIRPDIDISEWYAGRHDCGCTFVLEVQLLGADETVIDDFSGEWGVVQWKGRAWHQVSHKFTGYKPGVRFIKYTHKGKDTQFWAGHYGPKFTGASVRFNIKK